MENRSVLPDGRTILCKMIHDAEITLVFQKEECPETLSGVTSQIMAAYAAVSYTHLTLPTILLV